METPAVGLFNLGSMQEIDANPKDVLEFVLRSWDCSACFTVAESLRFLKRGTSIEAKVLSRRSLCGKLGVRHKYDGVTNRERF